mmetsp:Transcript_19037/g.32574  ORF Transcript_19037/g.32574 Transcript_19037/m.32574 type:complete len:591 (-) Transcript_19037:575-2347(-)|eukprot:CAMPEP_0119102682 /NCGR_PEP_ID=MMETSP1180-20130426/1336_1 /TAXON_ID=3052 ORGANISM="Chlamydomonas cf sp, Strain CCMP681" /NCGR_SAMPLE_ID=MMETSP1180 /ASSEMBLY_ACC=CAM_ASM_000741 /LENGTH=590 /DNA_ID=CAMNT_0007087009 /DNA_START=160 /DNA_END=1932 /DNA_ORIENTATION=+
MPTVIVSPTTARDEFASPMDVESDEICWICLDEMKAGQALISPCKCPRKVHPQCMARWQLQQAGRAEETHCRFCNSALDDWKDSLTPDVLKPEVDRVQPIMVVYFEGEIHRIPVRQGDAGLSDFTSRIRELFQLPTEVDISLTFGCKEPMSGHHLKLEGMGAFDAAVHCASVAAAERQHKAGQRAVGQGGAGEGDFGSEDDEDGPDLLQSTLASTPHANVFPAPTMRSRSTPRPQRPQPPPTVVRVPTPTISRYMAPARRVNAGPVRHLGSSPAPAPSTPGGGPVPSCRTPSHAGRAPRALGAPQPQGRQSESIGVTQFPYAEGFSLWALPMPGEMPWETPVGPQREQHRRQISTPECSAQGEDVVEMPETPTTSARQSRTNLLEPLVKTEAALIELPPMPQPDLPTPREANDWPSWTPSEHMNTWAAELESRGLLQPNCRCVPPMGVMQGGVRRHRRTSSRNQASFTQSEVSGPTVQGNGIEEAVRSLGVQGCGESTEVRLHAESCPSEQSSAPSLSNCSSAPFQGSLSSLDLVLSAPDHLAAVSKLGDRACVTKEHVGVVTPVRDTPPARKHGRPRAMQKLLLGFLGL